MGTVCSLLALAERPFSEWKVHGDVMTLAQEEGGKVFEDIRLMIVSFPCMSLEVSQSPHTYIFTIHIVYPPGKMSYFNVQLTLTIN
jgi:hypothetical protein